MPIGESLILSVLGMAIVFAVLILLIVCIKVLSSCVNLFAGKEAVVAVAPVAAPAAVSNKVPAPGSVGEMNLHNVDDKTAAMLMAIVADKMNTPLNELRFRSIREIEK